MPLSRNPTVSFQNLNSNITKTHKDTMFVLLNNYLYPSKIASKKTSRAFLLFTLNLAHLRRSAKGPITKDSTWLQNRLCSRFYRILISGLNENLAHPKSKINSEACYGNFEQQYDIKIDTTPAPAYG